MDTKLPLQGPGIYLLDLKGARKQPIFRSLFEFDRTLSVLLNISGCTTLGWVLTEDRIRWLVDCQEDWIDPVRDLEKQLTQNHKVIWGKEKRVLAETLGAMAIDDYYLVDTLLQLHRAPVYEGLVPDASLYPWSSDRYYRSMASSGLTREQQPATLDKSRVLNLLSPNRHRRELHYEQLMASCPPATLNLESGNHPTRLALGRSAFVDKRIALERQLGRTPNQPLLSGNLSKDLEAAVAMVAKQLAMHPKQLMDPLSKRSFRRGMPLVNHLLLLNHYSYEEIASQIGVEEEYIRQWQKGLKASHPAQFVKNLESHWQKHQSPEPELQTQVDPSKGEGSSQHQINPVASSDTSTPFQSDHNSDPTNRANTALTA